MKPNQQPTEPLVLSFSPYVGLWTLNEASHLLRRTMLGPTLKNINDAVVAGMDATVAQLFSLPTFTKPVTYSSDETKAAIGTTWVDSVYDSDPVYEHQVVQIRMNSISAWLMERMNDKQVSIHEKMCLFWQNHFAVKVNGDSRASYDYFTLIRTFNLGNFREMVKKITVNPSMLMFLNGDSNSVLSPNENFAREILELFTIGKGPQIGVGNYTNYTEKDISESSKILTGWSVKGYRSDTLTKVTSYLNPLKHDTSDKVLSSCFGNAVIANAGSTEYKNYIDIIFQQAETAKFICRKLYRWFVNYDLTPEVESTIILEMSNLLIANDYEIKPVVEALLKSEHFYDITLRGAIIKSPIELMFSILNTTNSTPSYDIEITQQMYLSLSLINRRLGMDYKLPPNVGGWAEYYHGPSYSKAWVNASYIKLRFDLVDRLTTLGGVNVEGKIFKVNALDTLNSLSIPSDSYQIIDDLVRIYCPKGISFVEKSNLQFAMLDGLPDYEWTVEYNNYLADPANPILSEAIKKRIEIVLNKIFKLPQFQTI